MKIIKIKKGQRGGFFNMLLGTLGATVLGNLLSRITAKCVIIAGDGTIKVRKSIQHSSFKQQFCCYKGCHVCNKSQWIY